MGTMTIHRCGECNHQADNHAKAGGWGDGKQPRVGPCCFGGCACRKTPTQVRNENPEVQIRTYPENDRASWFSDSEAAS